jgi:hypothetical protein
MGVYSFKRRIMLGFYTNRPDKKTPFRIKSPHPERYGGARQNRAAYADARCMAAIMSPETLLATFDFRDLRIFLIRFMVVSDHAGSRMRLRVMLVETICETYCIYYIFT